MNEILEFLRTDEYVLISFIVNIILIVIVMINIYLNIRVKKKYLDFMTKLGKGTDIDSMLKKYLDDVREIKKDNEEIKAYYIKLDKDISSCIQKTGLVRYNAFKDVGSDLSFAVALLDRENNGVVLNGLYGSESSNIYAKPVKNGKSTYQLSEEEQYALEIAEQNKNFYAKHKN